MTARFEMTLAYAPDAAAQASGKTACEVELAFEGAETPFRGYLCPICEVIFDLQETLVSGADCLAQYPAPYSVRFMGYGDGSWFGGINHPDWVNQPLSGFGPIDGGRPPIGEDIDFQSFSVEHTLEGDAGNFTVTFDVSGRLETSPRDPSPPEDPPYACGWPRNDPGDLSSDARFALGNTLPNTALIDQCGEPVEPWDFFGEYLIIELTSPDCNPCRLLADQANAGLKRIRDAGVPVRMLSMVNSGLALPATPATEDLQRWWVERATLEDPVLRDDGYAFEAALQLRTAAGGVPRETGVAYPYLIFVSPEMEIFDDFTGFSSWNDYQHVIFEHAGIDLAPVVGPPTNPEVDCPVAPALVEQVAPWGTLFSAEAAIDAPHVRRYHRLEATGGQWYFLNVTNDFSPSVLDTVLTVYSGDGSTQLAHRDDRIPYRGFNSAMAWRAPATGAYCFEIRDWADANGAIPNGDPSMRYRLDAVVVDPSFADSNLDVEPNNDLAAAQGPASFAPSELGNGNVLTRFFGTFDAPDDADVYRFDVPAGPARYLDIYFTDGGPEGHGSTLDPGVVRLYEVGQPDRPYAELDQRSGSMGFLWVRVEGGSSYFLEVTPPAGAQLGNNPAYVVVLESHGDDIDLELDDVANAGPDGAQPLNAIGNSSGTTQFFAIHGTLSDGDEDWYAFDVAQDGSQIGLICNGQRAGSGVRSTGFGVLSSTGELLREEVEAGEIGVAWLFAPFPGMRDPASRNPLFTATAGRHYFRVRTGEFAPGVDSRFYQCALDVFAP